MRAKDFTLTTHCTGTTAPSAPVQSDDPQQGAQAASEPPAFDWARNWYPVALVGDLETERPNSLQLLGRHIAVWREPSGAWRAVEDKCPHRWGGTRSAVLLPDGLCL